MDAAWALPESPDLLGVADDCSTAGVRGVQGMARLFHPDGNTDAKDIETRTAHFLKIKKATRPCRTGEPRLYDDSLESGS